MRNGLEHQWPDRPCKARADNRSWSVTTSMDISVNIDSFHFDAVMFDLDGVLTDTASLHAKCWKKVFDELLRFRAASLGGESQSFEIATDYRRYLDGKPRLEGVRDFLLARGINLPEGAPSAPADLHSIHGIAKRKDRCFSDSLEHEGVTIYEDAVACLQQVRAMGLQTAVVSASHHCAAVLLEAKLADLFDTRVDGQVRDQLNLAGKPAPDTFLEAARRLEVPPERCAVVEDAIAGVQAARAGGFGLVVAVARHGNRNELAEAGADTVIEDLTTILPSP